MVFVVYLRVQSIDKHSADAKTKNLNNGEQMNEFFSNSAIKAGERCPTNLENMTNSRKDLVGRAQLCIADHV